MKQLVRTAEPFIIETDFYGEPILSLVIAPAQPSPPNPDQRARLMRGEQAMKDAIADEKLVPFDCPVTHYFTDGVYMRQMFIPAGVALFGHIHRHPCLNIVMYGEIEVATEAGRKRITGPVTFESLPGTKRAGYALKDTLWVTIHKNIDDLRDIAALEDRLIAQSFDEFLTAPDGRMTILEST